MKNFRLPRWLVVVLGFVVVAVGAYVLGGNNANPLKGLPMKQPWAVVICQQTDDGSLIYYGAQDQSALTVPDNCKSAIKDHGVKLLATFSPSIVMVIKTDGAVSGGATLGQLFYGTSVQVDVKKGGALEFQTWDKALSAIAPTPPAAK